MVAIVLDFTSNVVWLLLLGKEEEPDAVVMVVAVGLRCATVAVL
jgi:hypothetical protein